MPSNVSSPASSAPGLLGAQFVVADRFDRPIEREVVATGVVGVARERAEREHVVAEEVAPPDLDRVDAQLERGLVDEAFQQRRRLRATGTAVGPHRRGVGHRYCDVELDRRERVRALRHPSRAAGQERTHAGIRAGVADQAHLQPGEVAVAGATEFGVLDLAAAVGECLHVVAARRHPHHRSTGSAGGGRHDGVLGVDAGLAAEATADLRGDHSDVGGLHPECRGQLAVQTVRHLC